MVLSMTGYAQGVVELSGFQFQIDIKTLNSKGLDLNLRGNQMIRQKEIAIRKLLSTALRRGKVEIYFNENLATDKPEGLINKKLLESYWNEAEQFATERGLDKNAIAGSIFRIPDVYMRNDSFMDDKDEAKLLAALKEICGRVTDYRTTEGKALEEDLLISLGSIERLMEEIEPHEAERMILVKQKLMNAFNSNDIKADQERFEQELIYYLEKLDINEEKSRLRAHCNYFREILLNSNTEKGKKLGFISQEMGREINTLGSKSSHAPMQQIVVGMKESLERIKEQVLNAL